MSYADLFVGILLIALLIIVAVRVLSSHATGDGRKLWRDDQGRLVAIGEREPSAGQLSGRGTQTSAPLQLAAGTYRIDYQFEALTRLALIDANGDDTLLITSGTGAEVFHIADAGRYRLLLEPADEGAAWRVAYRWISEHGETSLGQ